MIILGAVLAFLACVVVEALSDRQMQREHEARLARLDAWVGSVKGGRP